MVYLNGYKRRLLILGIIFCLSITLFAGQTGKIVGRVIDDSTGEPLPGVNIIIEETSLGAASDLDGDFHVINIPPGIYTITAKMISYQEVHVTNVKIVVDQTTRFDFDLKPTTLELDEAIIVEADRPIIQKDLTATASSVSADEIENMPVESLEDILNLQAGVVVDKDGEFHIRGGRASEVAYLVDGVSITDPFSGKKAISVDPGVIQELKVISGTFNAEYGQVMSGIVEIVTKDPENEMQIGGTVYSGDYLSSRKDLFFNIDDLNPADVYNLQLHLTGPLSFITKKIGYYLSFRRHNNSGWIYGERRYNPTDSSHFERDGAYIEQTGDNIPVAMNFSSEYYGNMKLVFKITPMLKINYSLLGNFYNRRFYNHLYKYNPDGDKTNFDYGITNILDLNHALSANTFYTLKLSHYYYDFESYLYKDRNDPRYANPDLLNVRDDAFSFLSGGTNMEHERRSTTVDLFKFDITSQLNKIHQIKSGVELKNNVIKENNFLANYKGIAGGGIFSSFTFLKGGRHTHDAIEGSAYIQDKIELENLTVNAGLRYDYFDSKGNIPLVTKNPDSAFTKAKVKHQWSPRIGLAFPISANGVIHASYGHFYQIPPYEFLYKNPKFAVNPGGLSTLMGNADLKPQVTVIYEIGFQQELFGQIGIDATGFYKDARNLLGTKIFDAGGGDRYARYSNRDYGNTRGITISVNKRPTPSDHISVAFDYTFQVAEGNASDPNHEFNNQQTFPPKKSNIQVVPLDWDQRHTINLSLIYHNPEIITSGIILKFQSGLPYTPKIQNQETTFENSGRKQYKSNVDFRLSRDILIGGFRLNAFVKIYNLFDQKNEEDVYDDTGRAGYSLVSHYTGERNALVNTLDDWIKRPDYYSEPRKIFMGMSFNF